jgi:hypothetical protein
MTAVPETPLERLQHLSVMLNSLDEKESLPEIHGEKRKEHEEERNRILRACNIELDRFINQKSSSGPLTKG